MKLHFSLSFVPFSNHILLPSHKISRTTRELSTERHFWYISITSGLKMVSAASFHVVSLVKTCSFFHIYDSRVSNAFKPIYATISLCPHTQYCYLSASWCPSLHDKVHWRLYPAAFHISPQPHQYVNVECSRCWIFIILPHTHVNVSPPRRILIHRVGHQFPMNSPSHVIHRFALLCSLAFILWHTHR